VKRSFKFIGAVLLTLVIVIGGLAWYVASLPWQNACAAPRPSFDRPAAEAFDEPRLRSAPEAVIRDPARQRTEFVFGHA
jgi:hypothetical protein